MTLLGADGQAADVFDALDEFLASAAVTVDRPRDTGHPRYPEIRYPVDYGYIEGTTSSDGDGIDVFRGHEKGSGVVGFFLTVDRVKKDVEMKIVADCSPSEVELVGLLLRQMNLPHLYVPRP